MGKEKKVKKTGKRVRKGRKHKSSPRYKFYEVKGDEVVRKGNFCPRCGPGIWLSHHKNREYCGRCSYTEFTEK